MVYRCISPSWLSEQDPTAKKVLEGEFSDETIKRYNSIGYNIYFLPNSISNYDSSRSADGTDIDRFSYVFVDMDLKDGFYSNKSEFIDILNSDKRLTPSFIVDSGNGVHAYYSIIDLDAMSFLRLQRRLCRLFNTDEAVSKIFQLMRLPGTINTKHKDAMKPCEIIETSIKTYTCEELDRILPPISIKDEEYCKNHYDKTYNRESKTDIDENIPVKFGDLLRNNSEAKQIWLGGLDDRSKGDFRLGHIMLAAGFTKAEAMSVLINAPKALARAPAHRSNYAENIVSKIWAYEQKEPETTLSLSSSVEEILSRSPENSSIGKRFPCHEIVDGTKAGFRLTQVLGLVGGSGVGKTTFALNLFRWFVEANPEHDHFFVSLEQPVQEIAARWSKMCQGNTLMHKKVQVLGNYNPDGTYRNLSLEQIKHSILEHEKRTNRKVGCVVLDHIGVLKRNDKNGETQGLAEVSKSLKSFANETNTFFVVQSQTNRVKSGIGDIELDKDAAYGTTAFEWYVDMLITIWAPLKRMYDKAPNMTVTAFKYCKIRDKNVRLDRIQEDQRYLLMYDVDTEKYRRLTEDEEKSFIYLNSQATNLRKQDKKTDVSEYKSVPKEGIINAEANSSGQSRRST